MDLGSTIVGLIIIALGVLPFIILSRGEKKKEKQLLQSISKIAATQNCTISQHDFCSNFVIGLDEAKKHVFLYKESNQEKEEIFVDLAQVKACKLIKEDRRINNKNESYSIIDKLYLSFKTFENKEIRMEFYSSDVNLQLSGELQMIEKWQQIIKSKL